MHDAGQQLGQSGVVFAPLSRTMILGVLTSGHLSLYLLPSPNTTITLSFTRINHFDHLMIDLHFPVYGAACHGA